MTILRSLDFDRVTIDMFTIEDNATPWTEHRAHAQLLIGGVGFPALSRGTGSPLPNHTALAAVHGAESGPADRAGLRRQGWRLPNQTVGAAFEPTTTVLTGVEPPGSAPAAGAGALGSVGPASALRIREYPCSIMAAWAGVMASDLNWGGRSSWVIDALVQVSAEAVAASD
eukprot:gene42438-57453_t